MCYAVYHFSSLPLRWPFSELKELSVRLAQSPFELTVASHLAYISFLKGFP